MINWDAYFIGNKEMKRFEILKTYQDRTIPDLGERRLLAAVLLKAIEDLDPKTEAIGDYISNIKVNTVRIKQSALYWIKSSNNSFNSFIGICEMLGIYPNQARRKLLNGAGYNK